MNIKRENFEYFMIGQKAALIRDGKCLILEMASQPGFWELPGGRIDKGELRKPALKREMKEELGLDNFEILGVVDYDVWYWYDRDIKRPTCATVHLIKNNNDEITLSEESLQYKWISEDEIEKYKFFWDVAPRFIQNSFKLNRLLNKDGN